MPREVVQRGQQPVEGRTNVYENPQFRRKAQADMVIIGGGPGGLYLADKVHQVKGDNFKVVVLEQNPVADGGSSRAGLKQFRTMQGDPDIADLVTRTEGWYKSLGEEVDGNPESFIDRFPYLFLAKDAKQLARYAEAMGKAKQAGYGATGEILSGEEVRERLPFVDQETAGAIYYPEAGKFDFPRAIGEIMRRSGNTTFALGTEAGDILVKNGKIKGIQTSGGFIRTDKVVLAAGAYLRGAEGKLGGENFLNGDIRTTDDVDVRGQRKQVVSVQKRQSFINPIAKGALPENTSVYVIADNGAYVRLHHGEAMYGWADPSVRHEEPGDIVVVPQASEADFPVQVYDHLSTRAMSAAYGTEDAPGPLRVTAEQRKAGYYTDTPDELPLIDDTKIEGLYVLGALSHAGIMTGYGAADRLVDEIIFPPKPKRRWGGLRRALPAEPKVNPFTTARDFGAREGLPL